MRAALIYFKGELAGELTQHDNGSYTFEYNAMWISDTSKPSISLTLPKTTESFHSVHLFSFFYNMLPEGANRQMVCAKMKIDEKDEFGLLLTTAQYDTIGAVTVTKSNKK
jgi:HipA-like protein